MQTNAAVPAAGLLSSCPDFRFDIWSNEARANPHPIYAEMRRLDPVHLTIEPKRGRPIWILTRYDDCVAFLKDPRFGKDIHRKLPKSCANRWWREPDPADPILLLNHHVASLDPPDHSRLRGLVHKAFTPCRIERMRQHIEQIAATLLQALPKVGPVDLIAAYAHPLPAIVVSELLGVPASDRERFERWTKVILYCPERAQTNAALGDFAHYLNTLIDRRTAAPEDDLISALAAAEESGDRLSRPELLSMLFLLLVAGHETAVNLIGNGVLALLRHPEQLLRLRCQPALLRTAVEEMLRYDGPVDMTTNRWALEDVEIRGMRIARGDMVWASLVAANRDPLQFADPDRFDIAREPNRHVAFGFGIHACLGAMLARLEAAAAIGALVRRFPSLDLAVALEDLTWISGMMIVRGVTRLPVHCRVSA